MPKKTAVASTNEASLVVKSAASALKKLPTFKKITKREDYDQADLVRSRAKAELKNLDAKKKAITTPLNTALKEVRNLFKPVEDAGKSFVADLDSVMIGYLNKEKEKQLKRAEKRAAKASSKQEAADILEAAKNDKPAVASVGTVVKEVWAFKVVDQSKIPDEFWVVDTVALRKAVMANPEGCKIPGVKTFKEFRQADKR